MHVTEFKHYPVVLLGGAKSIARTLLAKTLCALRLLPGVARKRAVLRAWLISARAAQITAVVLVVAMWTVVLPAVDARLEKRYHPISIKKMFGLKKEFHRDPLLDDRKALARTVLWASSGGLVLFLLLLHLPATAARETELARARESEADALTESEPSAGKLLYASALSLAIDREFEASLVSKLRAAEERASKKTAANHVSQIISPASNATAQTLNLEDMESSHVPDYVAQPGANDERYAIKRELGRGAMGIVYLAHDSVLDRTIALKQLPTYLSHEERLVARFQQEARALARLNHPNIVQVYDFIRTNGECWIAMEYVEGEELQEMLGRLGALNPREAIRLGIQMAEALDYAHENGVIHRDFKPANVLMTPGGTPKITDFGLAKLVQSSLRTQEGAMLGSPAYMSPEQAQGKPSDERADIYALGVTLFKMMTNKFPFEGDLDMVIAQKLIEDPPSPSRFNEHVPEAFDRIVVQMLAKDPEARPNSMRECAQVLKTLENPSAA